MLHPTWSWLLEYFAPSMGVIMATMMFAAPIADLREALRSGSLKTLNPFPWPFLTGNCLGWVLYAHYTADPFVLAANVPGLILSLWLNMGAAKLQYAERIKYRPVVVLNNDSNVNNANENPHDAVQAAQASGRTRANIATARLRQRQPPQQSRPRQEQHWDASPPLVDAETAAAARGILPDYVEYADHSFDHPGHYDDEDVIFVPVERALLRILIVWTTTAIVMGWMGGARYAEPRTVIGLLVNANLVVFYSAPLQSLQTVVWTKRSDSIHRPTLYMNYVNTTFWILYGGLVRNDPMIYVPNAMGLSLGIIQGILCCMYPSSSSLMATSGGNQAWPDHEPILGEEEPDDDHHNNDDDDVRGEQGRTDNTHDDAAERSESGSRGENRFAPVSSDVVRMV